MEPISTCVWLEEIFSDEFELWMCWHIWRVSYIYRLTKFHVKHLLRHFSTRSAIWRTNSLALSDFVLVWSVEYPSWSYVHVFLHGLTPICALKQRPSLPYTRRPNQTECKTIRLKRQETRDKKRRRMRLSSGKVSTETIERDMDLSKSIKQFHHYH